MNSFAIPQGQYGNGRHFETVFQGKDFECYADGLGVCLGSNSCH
jgi:hypothetical protein